MTNLQLADLTLTGVPVWTYLMGNTVVQEVKLHPFEATRTGHAALKLTVGH